MASIIEKIVEPSKIYVGSTFKIKIKVDRDYSFVNEVTTENNLEIITENANNIRTEWGD